MDKISRNEKIPAKRLPQHIYREESLLSLRIELRAVARRRKLVPEKGEEFLWRLSGPLKVLDELYLSAKEMFSENPGAEKKFRGKLMRLIEGAPEGGVRLLHQRTRLSFSDYRARGIHSEARVMARPSPGFGLHRGLDCSLVYPEAMAVLYLATLRSDLGDLTQRGLDVVAALSIAQGHMEFLNEVLVSGGPSGFEEQLLGGYAPGMPGIGNPGDGPPGWTGYQPDPDDPFGPIDPWGGWGGGSGGGWQPPPSEPGSCQDLREACEAILIDHANAGLPPMPMPPGSGAWADTIESIEMLGHCAGDLMILHGQGFGSSQPPDVHLVVRVENGCAVVQPQSWTDTRIEARLPPGIRSGPVGFYSSTQQDAEVNRYNNEAAVFNSAAREMMAASQCIGAPLDFDLFPLIKKKALPCAPAEDHNIIQAGPPVIHYFHIATDHSSGTVIAAAPEEELVLRWSVENADTIELRHVWVSGSDSSSEVIANDASGSSWNLGPTNHTAFGESTYRLTARNACGQVQETVRVICSQHPGLVIERVEVTQSIQTAENDVPLIRHKPTVVRIFGTHGLEGFWGLEEVANVTGRIRVKSGSFWSFWFSPINNVTPSPPDPPLPDPGASINLPEIPDPTQINHTLNFIIPEALCEGTLDIEVELRVDDFGAPPGSPGFSERVSRLFEEVVTFRRRRRLKMRYIPATIVPDPTGNQTINIMANNPPTDAECRDFLLETFKLLPTMPSSIERLEGFDCTLHVNRTVITTPWGSFQIDSGWSESLQYDVEANAFTYMLGILRTCELLSFTGFICTEDHDAYWAVIVPATGVWGRANGIPGREYITPMRAVAGGHELAHCLNQHHLPGTGCANGGDPVANPLEPTTDPANWTDAGQIPTDVAVPFDVIQNRTITDSLDGVWDLMTYCQTRWTTAQRWRMVFDFIGE